MIKYTTKQAGERFDNIVFNHYKDLSVIGEVLKENSHIKPILNVGDIVNLPYVTKKVKEKVLW